MNDTLRNGTDVRWRPMGHVLLSRDISAVRMSVGGPRSGTCLALSLEAYGCLSGHVLLSRWRPTEWYGLV